MRLNEGTEWAIHCCSILAALPQGVALSAQKLAEYFDLPEHYLAKHLQQLSNANILNTRKGPGGGYQLAKSPDKIQVLEIVQAVDGKEPSFRCSEIRQRGPTGQASSCYRKPCGIARTMWSAEEAWRAELKKVSLSDIQRMGVKETPKQQIEQSVQWFQDVLR